MPKKSSARTGSSGSKKRAPAKHSWFLPDGAYCFRDCLAIDGVVTISIVTCRAWLLELHQLESGAMNLINGSSSVAASGRSIGILFPPFAISRVSFDETRSSFVGVASFSPLPASLSTFASVFDIADIEPPSRTSELIERLRNSANRQRVRMRASALSWRAKKMIDAAYPNRTSIAGIADSLSVTNSHLSRQFKSDFALTPREYVHQLRIADAPLRLAAGEAIADVSTAVGYGDLTRFYTQFRKTTAASPAACKAMLTPKVD